MSFYFKYALLKTLNQPCGVKQTKPCHPCILDIHSNAVSHFVSWIPYNSKQSLRTIADTCIFKSILQILIIMILSFHQIFSHNNQFFEHWTNPCMFTALSKNLWYHVTILLYECHGLGCPKQTYKILTYNNIFILFRQKIILNNI